MSGSGEGYLSVDPRFAGPTPTCITCINLTRRLFLALLGRLEMLASNPSAISNTQLAK